MPLPALLTMALPALLPPVIDGVRGLFATLFGGKGAEPQNVEERIKLMAAETERLKALSLLDQPASNISQWVADLRGGFRYIAAGVVLLSGTGIVGMALYDPTFRGFAEWYLEALVAPVWSFIFGERMYMHLKNGGKQ